jgi:hypothetical protein
VAQTYAWLVTGLFVGHGRLLLFFVIFAVGCVLAAATGIPVAASTSTIAAGSGTATALPLALRIGCADHDRSRKKRGKEKSSRRHGACSILLNDFPAGIARRHGKAVAAGRPAGRDVTARVFLHHPDSAASTETDRLSTNKGASSQRA